jgi:hypothetical protein
MKKLALFIILLVGVGFPALSVEQAGDKAQSYIESSEAVTIHPNGLTISGTDSYWVMELVGSLSQIRAMLPINSETGNIESDDAARDVLETHYLANYLTYSDAGDTVSTHFQSTLTFAQGKKIDFNAAISDINQYAPQIRNAGYDFPGLVDLNDSLVSANAVNDELRNNIQLRAQPLMAQTNWRTSDLADSNTIFSDVFSSEGDFLNAMSDVSAKANAFQVEIVGNSQFVQTYQTLALALQSIITVHKLTEDVTQRNDTLKSSRNAINQFFDGLDNVGTDYLAKLRARMDSHLPSDVIANISSTLTMYATNYSYIVNNSDSIPPSYQTRIDDLKTLIDGAQLALTAGNYTLAQTKFGDISDLIDTLTLEIGQCPTSCTGGKTLKDCACTCPSNTKEESGKCVSTGFTLNPYLIGGLILIIIVLIAFKYKDKILPGGGEVVVEKKPDKDDMWTGYKF